MKPKMKVKDILINIGLVLGIVVCVFLIVFKFTFTKVVVKGSSMNPTIDNGATGYMVKVSKHTKLERFDVVSSKHGDDESFYIIKRILGLPNEQVSLKDNVLTINGQVIEQNFSFIPTSKNFSVTNWTLNDNEYLLVGDNREITIEPEVKTKEQIFAKNGFVFATYDVLSNDCINGDDYSSCPIDNRKWYYFKNGKQ